MASPNRLRWDRPDGTYQIDDGRQLWDINEQENQAVPQASRYFAGDPSRIDLLQLLDIGKSPDQAAVLAQRPAEQVMEDGVECDVYQWTAKSVEGTVEVKVVASASPTRCCARCVRSCCAKAAWSPSTSWWSNRSMCRSMSRYSRWPRRSPWMAGSAR